MHTINKYIGRIVNLIYMDGKGKISMRTVALRSVKGGIVRGHCYAAGAPRTFALDRILAVEPAARRAV